LAFDTKSARIDDERNCGQLACVITSEYLWKPVILEDVISRLGTNALSVAEIEDYFKSSGFEVIESKPESVASGDEYVVRGTMRIGSIGIFEQSVYISMHSQADSSETVVALKLLATALSGPKLVESSKTISISSFGEAGLYSDSFLVPASVEGRPHRFEAVTWDNEQTPFVSLRIENREEAESPSRLFVEVKSDAPVETQVMVRLLSTGPDGTDVAELGLKILNDTIASIVPATALVELDGTLKVWFIAPVNSPTSRLFYKLFDEHETELASGECKVTDQLDSTAQDQTKVVSLRVPSSVISSKQHLIARLFDGTDKELGSFQAMIPSY